MDTVIAAASAPELFSPSGSETGAMQAAESRTSHVPGLDGICGIAVTLVLLYHFFIYRRTYATGCSARTSSSRRTPAGTG